MGTPAHDRGDAARLGLIRETFRSANVIIAERAVALDVRDAQLPFVCECGDQSCTTVVRLTLVEFEQAREAAAHFVVVPGHERVNERVLHAEHRYVIVAVSDAAAASLDM